MVRADAERNRRALVDAARDVFVEHGPAAALDLVADRAGVGIATLYRHFPNRAVLLEAVVLDVLCLAASAAGDALAEEPTAFDALVRYMHAAIDIRIAAVMPVLVGDAPMDDPEIVAARDLAVAPVQEIIDRARADGSLRPGIEFGDIGLLLIRLSRPLPGRFPPPVEDQLTHRHTDVVIDGLRAGSRHGELGGSGPTLADLQRRQP